MFVNNYKINLSTLASGTTATTINIPINMEFQIVDQSDLIERVFVKTEVEKAINPIIDYEKVRFTPTDSSLNIINSITYNLNLNGLVTYGAIGFTDDDIKFNKGNFKETFLELSFYDTDNPMTQKLVSYITLFSTLTNTDLLPINSSMAGQPKPATQIGLSFTVSNPKLNPMGNAQGYYIYDYKDEVNIGEFKYLYMKASFKNAKTGKNLNLMVESTPSSIDQLIHKLYTRYKLIRTTNSFYYQIDNTYHGNGTSGSNNVAYSTNNITINLYQILAL